jgi:hypothetical protein
LKTLEELHAELVQPTAHLAGLAHSRPNNDPEELQEITNLWLNPISEHERYMYGQDFAGDVLGFEFERYVVGRRRIDYARRQLEASRGGNNE